MIGSLIGIVFTLIVFGVIYWAFQQLIGIIPLAEPFVTIIRVVIAIIGALVVLTVIAELLQAGGIHVAWPSIR